MLRVPLKQLRDGMKLALPVFHPYRPTSQLVASGCRLQPTTVERLEELHVHDVWVHSPRLSLLSRYITPELVLARRRLAEDICLVLDHVLAGQVPDSLDRLRSTLHELQAIYARDRQAAVFLPCTSQGDEFLVRHAADTAVLALLTAMRLKNYIRAERREAGLDAEGFVEKIALGAALHDIGLYMLKTGPHYPAGPDWMQNVENWQDHVTLGHEVVKPAVSDAVASVILHHHQHYDGSGFPRSRLDHEEVSGLKGHQIPVYVRVVSAADLFDELRFDTHLRPIPLSRVRRMLLSKKYRTWLDPLILRALRQVTLPYPPGMRVELSNGSTGYVVDYHPEHPGRPLVQTFNPEETSVHDGQLPLYDLLRLPDLSIVEQCLPAQQP